MRITRALVYRPSSEIGLSQNPSLASQEVFGAFLSRVVRIGLTAVTR